MPHTEAQCSPRLCPEEYLTKHFRLVNTETSVSKHKLVMINEMVYEINWLIILTILETSSGWL